ncbi:MAG: rhodanese-related sulfurtransferase [Pseudomonadota bacterium]
MHVIAALYHFTSFEDPAALRPRLLELCEREGIRGTLLLAPEGINGTISGTRAGIDAALAAIIALPGCHSLEWKESFASAPPFKKLKIRLKREIVTMGQPQVKPRERTGHYVDPSEWNALIAAPDVVTIDTRNDFEVAIGSFEGAIDPQTTDFRDFPGWWQENKARFEGKRIAMFCTGGIRCEKSTNYLLGEGVEDVFHLKGGILKYLETVPEDQSTWHGECFVFDKRVSVGHGLKEGEHILCHACRRAIRPEDTARAEYEEGVRCHLCVDEYAEADRARFRERMKQRRIGGHD